MRNQTILFFGYIDFGHPLGGRAEALTRAIAEKGFETIFIEMPFSPLGFIRSIPPQTKKFREFIFPKVKREKNITIISACPILPFARLKLIRGINKVIVGLWLKKILSKTIKNNIKSAIIPNTWWVQIIKYLGISKIYYDCIDDVSVTCASREIKNYKKWEEKLVGISKCVFVITPLLKEHILNIDSKKEVILFPNGVNVKLFKKQMENFLFPEDILKVKRPIVGYIGGISPWVDLELLVYCAKKLKDWSFVLVGPVTSLGIEKILLDIPNVYLLGLKPYKDVPHYINAFDVCLIPFKLDEMGNPSDPVKLYEYLSIGKPVVTTNIDRMKELNEFVYIGKDKDSFVEKIKEAYEKRNIDTEKRIHYAVQNSWDNRVNKLFEICDIDVCS